MMSLWIVRLIGRAPYTGSKPSFAMSDFALSERSSVIFRSARRFARIFVSFSTISMSCPVTRFLKMTISSTRFRNSGRN